MGTKIVNYLLMYFLYSGLGWTVESTYRSLGETYRARKTTKEKKIINSGFLNGPICPIYGAGAMIFEILLSPFKKHWWAVMLLGMVFADTMEYVTSVLMEKLFHARWWDYSEEFMNLHGRICLKHTIYWAVFSLLYVYMVAPIYDYLISFVPQHIRNIALAVIFVIFIVDFYFTLMAALNLQKIVRKMEGLRTNLLIAGDYVKAAAGTIKGSTLAKYDEFRDTVASTPERFEEWKADTAKQFRAFRAAFNGEAPQEDGIEMTPRMRRLYKLSPGVRGKLNKLSKDIEEKLEEIKGKFQ